MSWHRKHLLDIESLTAEEITTVLDTARAFKAVGERAIKKVPALRGRHGRQPLHRTFHAHPHQFRAFRATAFRRHHQLHRRSLVVEEGRNAQGHGEEPRSAERRFHRHPPQRGGRGRIFSSRVLDAHVINAGDGAHEHPTQALLDAFTIREHKGQIAGLNVTILGDILFSRVARSNIWALTKLGRESDALRPVHARAAHVRGDGLPGDA